MPRARVSPEKRKRTARACDSCKRSKLKCNGLHPCNTCSKEGRTCTFGGVYNGPDVGPDVRPPLLKRQLLDDGSASSQTGPQLISVQPPINAQSLVSFDPVANPLQPTAQLLPNSTHHTPIQHPAQPSPLPTDGQHLPSDYMQNSIVSYNPSCIRSPALVIAAVPEEEAIVYNFPRLLEDPTGRLHPSRGTVYQAAFSVCHYRLRQDAESLTKFMVEEYLGDSATLSYLQIIRKDVESIAGPSPFTTDPQQHQIVENTTVLPQNVRNTHLLPEKATAIILVDAFFTNTSGICQAFNEGAFMKSLDSYFSDPLHVDHTWLCLFHLTLAIGLVLATPLPGSPVEAVIQKLRADPIDQAELFYSNARNLCDPTTGFENADFWSIQALLLMAIYTLTVSKRNAAFAYCGMASRSGFALGLHREETLAIFSDEEQVLRRNLWRSIFVLDCFLAASMGRPTAISEDDCSGEILATGSTSAASTTSSSFMAISSHSSALGLDASVRSCRIIGTILKRVYAKRKISTKLAQEIADECGLWPEALDWSLHSRQMNTASIIPSPGIAILHVNLLYCHTIILLTRPFFLFLLNKVQTEKMNGVQRSRRIGSRIEKFSEYCVSASCHSILLAQCALEGNYLSYRNPFVIYMVFAAALIILSNEFFKLYTIPMAQEWIKSSISIIEYCAQTDPIAHRLLVILSSFRDVVICQKGFAARRQLTSRPEDPILNFLSTSTEELSPDHTRRSSFASIHPGGTGPHTGESSNSVPISLQSQASNQACGLSPECIPRHGSLDGNDSLGDGEIEFDAFWHSGPRANPPSAGIPK